ncbi:Flagellar biosynthesis protein FlhA [bacterium HR39]|nr:Flagellar biosynthesis protein FlhA [bacterium HR39]
MNALAAILPPNVLELLRRGLRQSDILFGLGVVAILVVLILPIPTPLLDLLLAVSMGFSVLVLMTTMFVTRPLEFSSFPTILLVATMLRLSLNLASTRLILSEGHEGPTAAGRVIAAFGSFVMQGNVVIGLVVFVILVIVNFVVITKGSGRIAEVAARFTLDAMPGKQMAIDADLSAGLIDEAEARRRRQELEEESAFYGAMDGAAKFVRGDAVAGLLITAINLVGGLVIGVVQQGVDLAEAVRTYSVLTIGDGLVSQIPALVISTAAGILVSKSGTRGRADEALFGQLGANPRPVAVTAALLGLLALLPGLPALPFLLLAAVVGAIARVLERRRHAGAAAGGDAAEDARANPEAPTEDDPLRALEIDPMRLELGYGLLPLVGRDGRAQLPAQIRALRRQLAAELGFVMPPVRIQDNIQLPASTYVVRIKDIEAGRGEVRPGMLLVMNPQGGPVEVPGEDTREPTFGLPARWVAQRYRDEALARGYTVVDAATVITTHLTEIVKDNLADLLTFAETRKLLDSLPEEYRKLMDELVPARITLTGIQRVLQGLLAERVSIRDLPAILEAIGEAVQHTQSLVRITEHVRTRLARQISFAACGPGGYIPVVTLSPQLERAFHEALVGEGEDRVLDMEPARLQAFLEAVRETFERLAARGELPVLLVSPSIRPYVRSVIERFRPGTAVLSHAEIHPKVRIRTLGQI